LQVDNILKAVDRSTFGCIAIVEESGSKDETHPKGGSSRGRSIQGHPEAGPFQLTQRKDDYGRKE
jgi:hypothetical protein